MNRFVLLGIDDEQQTCELCGKQDLKCTMALAELDADGSELGVVRYGRDCGARALGWRVSATRAESVADGSAKFTYNQCYDVESGRISDIDGVRIEVKCTFYLGAKFKRRTENLTDGWNRGPAPYIWRIAR